MSFLRFISDQMTAMHKHVKLPKVVIAYDKLKPRNHSSKFAIFFPKRVSATHYDVTVKLTFFPIENITTKRDATLVCRNLLLGSLT